MRYSENFQGLFSCQTQDPAHQWFRSVLLRSLEEKRAKKRRNRKNSEEDEVGRTQ